MFVVALVADSPAEPKDVAEAIQRVYEAIQGMFPRTASEMHAYEVDRVAEASWAFAAKLSLMNLELQRDAILTHGQELRDGFSGDVERRWAPGLKALRLLHEVAWEGSRAFHKHTGTATSSREVLARLNARGLAVADEAIHLLRGGFASGAMARWRTLHELEVVAAVIASGGDETAARYLQHQVVTRAKHARDYQLRAADLGMERLRDAELAEILGERDAAVARRGKGFASEYGWAGNDGDRRQVTFTALEQRAGREHLRPFYQYASQPIHGGAHGLMWEIGAVGKDIVLTGPSDRGLADPGQLLGISLVSLVRTFLTSSDDNDLRWRIYIDVLERLADQVADGFAATASVLSSEPGSAGPVLSAADASAPSMLAWPALYRSEYGQVFVRANDALRQRTHRRRRLRPRRPRARTKRAGP